MSKREKAKLKHKYRKESNILLKFNKHHFQNMFSNSSKRGEKIHQSFLIPKPIISNQACNSKPGNCNLPFLETVLERRRTKLKEHNV